MSKTKKEEKEVTVVGEDVKKEEVVTTEFKIPKDAIIDVAVTVISLKDDPYHRDGEEFQLGKKTAELLAEKGWVKIKE